jgi:hypothetical protein
MAGLCASRTDRTNFGHESRDETPVKTCCSEGAATIVVVQLHCLGSDQLERDAERPSLEA